MTHEYGAPPPTLHAADPRGGITLAEMEAWIRYLRADGAPDDAPFTVRTTWRTTIHRADLVVGDQLAKIRAKREA